MAGRGCRTRHPAEMGPRAGSAASDRSAPERSARLSGARQHPLPDAGIDGAAGSWRLAPRQAHSEHRTFARLARHGHVAAHHARELAGDGEAETGAAETLRGRGISLAEL